MKKLYESPEIKVIKYQKNVRTDQISYVTSGDTTTTTMGAKCPACGQMISVSVPFYLDPAVEPTPEEMAAYQRAANSAVENHIKTCPNSDYFNGFNG